jgi:hypothetical protein
MQHAQASLRPYRIQQTIGSIRMTKAKARPEKTKSSFCE